MSLCALGPHPSKPCGCGFPAHLSEPFLMGGILRGRPSATSRAQPQVSLSLNLNLCSSAGFNHTWLCSNRHPKCIAQTSRRGLFFLRWQYWTGEQFSVCVVGASLHNRWENSGWWGYVVFNTWLPKPQSVVFLPANRKGTEAWRPQWARSERHTLLSLHSFALTGDRESSSPVLSATPWALVVWRALPQPTWHKCLHLPDVGFSACFNLPGYKL